MRRDFERHRWELDIKRTKMLLQQGERDLKISFNSVLGTAIDGDPKAKFRGHRSAS